MAEFQYRARNKQGEVTKGTIKASSEERASEMLSEHGLVPIEIQNVEELSFLKREVRIGSGVSVRDRAVMARQLATMIQAGMPILQALRILSVQTENSRLADVLREISYDIEGGESLSVAMEKYPDIFSEFFVSMVRSGEHSGKIAETLEQLADHEERDYELISKVRGALIYPIFVIVLIIIVGGVLMAFVVPQLLSFFEGLDTELPAITKLFIAVATFISTYWWFLILFAILAIATVVWYVRTPEGYYNLHATLLRLPIFGKLIRKLYLARFTGALQTLISSEVPVVQSLYITRDVLGSRVYQEIIEEVAEDVRNGSTISDSLEQYPDIPLMVSQMISVGERSGELSDSLGAINRFYRRDVDDAFENLTKLVEPAVIVILGVVVAFIMAAVLLPMYQAVQGF